MNATIDLPPAPLHVTREEGSLADAVVVAHRMDGRRVRGLLAALSGPQASLALRQEPADPPVAIPFPELRYLEFLRPLPPPLSLPPVRRFRLVYRDGRELSGRLRASQSDAHGWHLYLVRNDASSVRLFVPSQAVKECLIDPLPGQEPLAPRPAASPERPAAMATPLRGDRPAEILEVLGAAGAEDAPAALARKLGLPAVRLREFAIDPQVVALVPYDIARRYRLTPVLLKGERLVVAMADPTDTEAINVLSFLTGRTVEVAVAAKDEIESAITRHYGLVEEEAEIEIKEDQPSEEEAQAKQELLEAERLAREKPIVRLVNSMIVDAIRRRASDIHLRPVGKNVDLIYRIDGTLIRIKSFSKALLPALVSRIKIIGRMNIAERRLPQDGSARVVDAGNVVDLRISVIPTVDGEDVVIRVLNTQMGLKAIAELGIDERDQATFTDLLHKSTGMILVTGPTGSGKSTTLYAALNEVRRQNVNIITVEDPVEYHIEGIEQIQVNTAAGYTFAKALRHILRHDPDVIMIGEIRDAESAKIAVESALTGHLVLSTLHTNDAATAVTRLLEMGIEHYLMSATLLGVFAQRLMRRNCPRCTEAEAVEPAIRRILGVPDEEIFYRGSGCPDCNHTGYSGRLAVYELLTMTPALRARIVAGVAAADLHAQAVKDGMVPLTENALARARQRVTSLAEAYRVRLE